MAARNRQRPRQTSVRHLPETQRNKPREKRIDTITISVKMTTTVQLAGCARSFLFALLALAHWACGAAAVQSALLVVDMQGCFLPGGPVAVSGDVRPVLDAINGLRQHGGFDRVVFTQDWHPPNHISFAPTHGKQPQDSLQLAYTCVSHIWTGKGGPRLCNMTHLYPDPQHSVTCASHPGGSDSDSDSDGDSGSSSNDAASKAGHDSTSVAAAAAVLAERIRSFGCPELVTQVQQVLWPRHCMRHSADARLHPDLIVLPEDLIVRKGWQPMIDAYSAFEDNGHLQSTGLAEQLRREGVRRVVVTGVALDFCVMWTALDAVAAGFETVLVLDGVLPVSRAGGADAVRRLRAAGVEVLQHARSLHVPAAAAGSHVVVQ